MKTPEPPIALQALAASYYLKRLSAKSEPKVALQLAHIAQLLTTLGAATVGGNAHSTANDSGSAMRQPPTPFRAGLGVAVYVVAAFTGIAFVVAVLAAT